MTRTNDRFDDEADPFGDPNEPTHPNLDRADVPPEAARIFRVPDHPALSRVRYQYDPVFHEAINVAYKRLNRADTPDDVFDEYAGRRLRITKNLLGEQYYGGDVEPFVAVVTEDERVDALLDWADDTPSPYARRDTPTSIEAARSRVDDDTADLIDLAEDVYENEAGVSRAEFAAFVADLTEADPVEAPSSRAEPGGSADTTPSPPVEWSWYDVARGTAIFVAVLILIVGAIYFAL